jgi:hypothetical protein
VATPVARDGTNGATLACDQVVTFVMIERYAPLLTCRFELRNPDGHDQFRGVAHVQSVLARKTTGAVARKQYVLPIAADRIGNPHRIAQARGGTHGTSTAVATVHDCCIELDVAVGVQYRTMAGIEELGIFECCYSHGNRVSCARPLMQGTGCRIGDRAQRIRHGAPSRIGEGLGIKHSGTAMDGNPDRGLGHGVAAGRKTRLSPRIVCLWLCNRDERFCCQSVLQLLKAADFRLRPSQKERNMTRSTHPESMCRAPAAWQRLLSVCALVVTAGLMVGSPLARAVTESERTRVLDNYGKLPITFVENRGQADAAIAYYLHAPGHSVYFARDGHALRLTQGHGSTAQAHVVKVELVGARTGSIAGRERAAGTVSHFRGPREAWKTELPTFSAIRYRAPWPGIELDYSSHAGQLESVYTVAPNADPALIRLRYSGQQSLRIDASGDLVYETSVGQVRESAPVVYQEINGERVAVSASFVLRDANTVAFEIAAYDRARALVIDPVLTYSGFIGGIGDDEGFAVDIDSAGNAYVVGYASSTETTFPVLVGPDLTHNAGTTDAFIAKVNPFGTALIYAGYIGGNGPDIGRGVAVDANGNAYITGYCTSGPTTFPVLVGPGLTYTGGSSDAFVAKVNPEGTALLYAGYIGGSGADLGFGIDIDASGNAYVVGNSDSPGANFPVLVGPDLTSNGGQDGFIAKVSASGASLLYAGFIGGNQIDRANAVAVDSAGFAYVTGPTASTAANFPVLVGPDLIHNGLDDAYVAKISANGSALIYAGYIGGSGNDRGNGIAVDSFGNAYVTGVAASTEATFPVVEGPDLTHNGGDDAFITKVSADGATLIYSGYIGGNSTDSGNGVAVNAAGAAYVVGSTFSTQASFPVLEGPDLTHNGATDIFVAKVNVAGTALNYAGYLGGNGGDPGRGIAVDNDGNAFVTGTAASSGGSFPVVVGPDLTSNGFIDAFVSRVTEPSDIYYRDGFE